MIIGLLVPSVISSSVLQMRYSCFCSDLSFSSTRLFFLVYSSPESYHEPRMPLLLLPSTRHDVTVPCFGSSTQFLSVESLALNVSS